MTPTCRAPTSLQQNSQFFLLCRARHNRKNWLFSWSEVGARHIGLIQSLLVTCRLHDVNPYTYLVDVLQRISEHPASRVEELVPRASGNGVGPA